MREKLNDLAWFMLGAATMAALLYIVGLYYN